MKKFFVNLVSGFRREIIGTPVKTAFNLSNWIFAKKYVSAKIYSIQNDLRLQEKVMDFAKMFRQGWKKWSVRVCRFMLRKTRFFRRIEYNLLSQFEQKILDLLAKFFKQGCQNWCYIPRRTFENHSVFWEQLSFLPILFHILSLVF